MVTETRTIRQWLEDVAGSNTSTEEDSERMQNLLHRVGFSRAAVVLGIVYLEGKGKPDSIQATAKALLKLG